MRAPLVATVALALSLAARANGPTPGGRPAPCTPEWYHWIESEVGSGDGLGHGPDVASNEWRSVIEFRLGIRGDPGIPDRHTDDWCRFIDRHLAGEDRQPMPR